MRWTLEDPNLIDARIQLLLTGPACSHPPFRSTSPQPKEKRAQTPGAPTRLAIDVLAHGLGLKDMVWVYFARRLRPEG